MNFPRYLAGAVLMLAAACAHAIDYRSVGPAAVVLYDAPSVKGNKLFVAPHGMPVEVVVSFADWVKVRDMSGDLSWTEKKNLVATRMVVVKSAGAKVRATADENGNVLYQADKGLLLELADPQVGVWVKVHHHDGGTGYVKASDIWGI